MTGRQEAEAVEAYAWGVATEEDTIHAALAWHDALEGTFDDDRAWSRIYRENHLEAERMIFRDEPTRREP